MARRAPQAVLLEVDELPARQIDRACVRDEVPIESQHAVWSANGSPRDNTA